VAKTQDTFSTYEGIQTIVRHLSTQKFHTILFYRFKICYTISFLFVDDIINNCQEYNLKLKPFLQLTRIEYSVFAAVAVVIAGFLAEDFVGSGSAYYFGFLVILFATMGTFAFNDYYDAQADNLNNRSDRPIVNGTIKRKDALGAGLILYAVALLLSLFINFVAVSFVIAHLFLYFLYSFAFKRMCIVKNVIIGYGFASAILFGTILSNLDIEPITLYFAAMSFIVGFAFEVMIDIGDVDGDKRCGVITIPVQFSKKAAAFVSVIPYFIIMVMDPLPFFIDIDPRLKGDLLFFVLILLPVAGYLYIVKSLLENQSTSNIARLKKITTKIMQVGTLVYLFGIFV